MRAAVYDITKGVAPTDDSDEAVEVFVRKHVSSTFHYSCTCRMAPREEGGVVEAQLRVHGVKGLRIADCSTLPRIPAGHTQAPAVIIGTKCAQLIISGDA